jgi:hypothetical protein
MLWVNTCRVEMTIGNNTLNVVDKRERKEKVTPE